MTDIELMVDFVGSLALLAILAILYGELRRRLPARDLASPVLGALFGLVAVVQMNAPFSPVEGLIIDMRNVPIALAGAFLGLRGLVVCLVIAAAMRLQIGGIGAASGLAAMIIAGGAGIAWHGLTAHRRRGWQAMTTLAALMSLHIVAVVLLPVDLARWFMIEAAPVVIGLNFICVPLVGVLLERERLRMQEEDRLRAAAAAGAGDGFMPREALEWALTQAAASGALRGEVVSIGLRLRHQGLFARLWGTDVDRQAMRAMRERLEGLMPAGGVVGLIERDVVLMSIPGLSEEGLDNLRARIRREVTETPVKVVGAGSIRLTLDVSIFRYPCMPAFTVVASDLLKPETEVRDFREDRDLRRLAAPARTAGSDTLFCTFDRLHALRFNDS